MRVVISSGHGLKVRGASGYLDEVDEARRVVNRVAEMLQELKVTTYVFHDDVSTSQNENLNRIVSFHNSKERDLDISVHFNAYQTTNKPMGCEVLYVSSGGLAYADPLVDEMCQVSGLLNRGPKKRTDLYFLNNTEEPAILIETCFVDSSADADIYHREFEDLCVAIASTVSGQEDVEPGPEPLPPPISNEQKNEVIRIALESNIANYNWKDRGKAPKGYTQGFALAWSTVVQKHIAGHPTAIELAAADKGDPDDDALSWYEDEFRALHMDNSKSGLDTLRHLFALLIGLGMRESSGQHCEGRDMSASNVTSDTAEAGLYQTSYNANTCSGNFNVTMDEYKAGHWPDYIDEFEEGVSCSAEDWQSYGSGRGKEFQDLCKNCPPFAVETAALVLRNRRQHYGPINRKEAELRADADLMLMDIQKFLQGSVEPTLEERVSTLEQQVAILEQRVAELESVS